MTPAVVHCPLTIRSTSFAPMSMVIGETRLPYVCSVSTAAWSWVLPGWLEWIANG